jgi:hypothetical protein
MNTLTYRWINLCTWFSKNPERARAAVMIAVTVATALAVALGLAPDGILVAGPGGGSSGGGAT